MKKHVDTKKSRRKYFGFIIYSIISFILMIFCYFSFSYYNNESKYLLVDGIILESIKQTRFTNSKYYPKTYYDISLKYKYEISGHVYIAKDYFSIPDYINVNNYTSGKQIKIYYNQDHPEKSVIKRVGIKYFIMFLITGLICFIIALISLYDNIRNSFKQIKRKK
jgi:hypothetical protein